jgi:hypothetical protein
VYSTKVKGRVLEFGTSGFLFRSNKLMYDKGTNTLWRQFTGEPVVGHLVGSGIKLEILPNTLTRWAEWVAAHPDTTVLDIATGIYPAAAYRPESDPASTYYEYRHQQDTMFPVPQRSGLLDTKARVFGLVVNGEEKAYPLEVLRQQPLIHDALGGRDLVVITAGDGGGARAYQREGRRFNLVLEGTGEGGIAVLEDDRGLTWRMEEEALVQVGDTSHRLPRLPSHAAYWFGWYAFHPGTAVFGQQ